MGSTVPPPLAESLSATPPDLLEDTHESLPFHHQSWLYDSVSDTGCPGEDTLLVIAISSC
jgi:hypothetical protein